MDKVSAGDARILRRFWDQDMKTNVSGRTIERVCKSRPLGYWIKYGFYEKSLRHADCYSMTELAVRAVWGKNDPDGAWQRVQASRQGI